MKNRDIVGTFLLAVLLFLVLGVPDGGIIRILLAAPLVLFLTGHVFLRLLGPIRVSFLEHSLYAVGVSLAFCVAGGFTINALSLLTPYGWAGWYMIITGLMLLIAILRRCEPMPLPTVTWPRLQRWHVIVLVLSLMVTTTAYGLAVHDEAAQKEFKYTEFWLIPKSNSDRLILGIKSAEDQSELFDVEITVDGVLFARWPSVEVVPGEILTRQFNVGVAKRVEARLYRSKDHALYRRVSAVLSLDEKR